MPTVSYSLHLQTALTSYDVLNTLFDTDEIEPIAGAGVLYTRGAVFLAHARVTESKLAEQFYAAHNIRPTVSVNYFPDGVSSVNTALDTLLVAALRWCDNTDDNLLLMANNSAMIFRCQNKVITTTRNHPFWSPDRLKMLDDDYRNVS